MLRHLSCNGRPSLAAQLNATAGVRGVFEYDPPVGTVVLLGTHILLAAFVPTDPSNYMAAVGHVALEVRLRRASDFVGDFASDTLWRGSGGDLWLWGVKHAAHATDAYVGVMGDPNWEIRAQGDRNGDGKADLVWRHKRDGTVYYWQMDGETPAAELFVATVDVSYDIVGTRDFDGDEKADILWRNIVGGDLWVWLMNGPVKQSEHYLGIVADQGYQIVK